MTWGSKMVRPFPSLQAEKRKAAAASKKDFVAALRAHPLYEAKERGMLEALAEKVSVSIWLKEGK